MARLLLGLLEALPLLIVAYVVLCPALASLRGRIVGVVYVQTLQSGRQSMRPANQLTWLEVTDAALVVRRLYRLGVRLPGGASEYRFERAETEVSLLEAPRAARLQLVQSPGAGPELTQFVSLRTDRLTAALRQHGWLDALLTA